MRSQNEGEGNEEEGKRNWRRKGSQRTFKKNAKVNEVRKGNNRMRVRGDLTGRSEVKGIV